MKAPDKIYMNPEELDERAKYLIEPYKDRDVVYIRKDALLEWIHTELDAIEGKEEMSQMELAFTEVIDKIQRM